MCVPYKFLLFWDFQKRGLLTSPSALCSLLFVHCSLGVILFILTKKYKEMIDKNLSYKITDKTLIKIASLERNLAILDENEIYSRTKYRVISESLFEDLFAINTFLKLNLTLGDIKKIVIGRDVDTKEAKLLSNIRQVFDFLQNNFKGNQVIFNFHLVQHIVKLLQSGILEIWDVGKIRNGSEAVEDSFELTNQVYENTDISNILADAIIWIEQEQDIHPVIKATVFMMFINRVSPFTGLNFVSSLVFFRVILEKYNYGSNFTVPIFKSLNDKTVDLHDLFNKSLSKDGSIGLTEIITEVSTALEALIQAYKKEFVEFDYVDIKSSTEKLDLNDRQLKLLKLLQQKVYIKRKEFMKLFKVSPMTAYRDLNYLVYKKLLTVSGQGKSTVYTLATKG